MWNAVQNCGSVDAKLTNIEDGQEQEFLAGNLVLLFVLSVILISPKLGLTETDESGSFKVLAVS